MMNTTKLLGIAAPALVGVGIVTAVLLGGGQDIRTVTLPSGTELVGVLDRDISTDQSSIGDAVQLRTEELVAEGASVRGTVTYVKGGGRIAGAPELAVLFTDLEVDGHRYPISVDPFRVKGQSDATESAVEIGGGTVAGGILGGVKGAVIGAAIGTGVAVATEGNQLTLAAGQKLRIQLTQPVTIEYRPRTEKAAQ
jgi:hypothetical protein